jgi:hypothetical protein
MSIASRALTTPSCVLRYKMAEFRFLYKYDSVIVVDRPCWHIRTEFTPDTSAAETGQKWRRRPCRRCRRCKYKYCTRWIRMTTFFASRWQRSSSVSLNFIDWLITLFPHLTVVGTCHYSRGYSIPSNACCRSRLVVNTRHIHCKLDTSLINGILRGRTNRQVATTN